MIETRWAQGLTFQITRRIRSIRQGQGMSIARFSEQCTLSGLPISQSAVSMMETSDRKGLMVQELLVFAHVLQVSPVELLLPAQGVVEVLPGIEAEAAQARQWVTGTLRFEEA
jgi:transcriptional regulator with XRE-family HTH domain